MNKRQVKIFRPKLKEWQAVDYDDLAKRVNEFLTQSRVIDPKTYALDGGIVVEYQDRQKEQEQDMAKDWILINEKYKRPYWLNEQTGERIYKMTKGKSKIYSPTEDRFINKRLSQLSELDKDELMELVARYEIELLGYVDRLLSDEDTPLDMASDSLSNMEEKAFPTLLSVTTDQEYNGLRSQRRKFVKAWEK